MPDDTTPKDVTPTEIPPEAPQTFEWPVTDEVSAVPEQAADVPPTAPTPPDPLTPTLETPPTPLIPTEPKSPKKKTLVILALSIIGVVALLSGATAAAYNMWYQNPDKVVLEAVGSLFEQGTSTHKVTIDIKTKEGTAEISIDAKLAAVPTSEADINALISYGGKDYTIKTSVITDKDGTIFLKLTNIKSLLTQLAGPNVDFSAFDSVINKVDGNWIKISSTDLKSVSADYSKAQRCTTDALKSLDDRATKNELLAVYKKNEFIVVGDKIGVKDIGGTASLGYKVTIDDAKEKTFIVALGQTKVGKALTACDSNITFEPSALETTSSQSNPTTSEIQVWSSRFGHQLKELDVTTKDKDTTVSIVWNPTFTPGVSVAIPTQSIPLNELITDVENVYTRSYSSAYSADPTDSTSNSFSTQKQLSQLLLK